MNTPELQTYIKQQLEAGITKDAIKQTLIEKQWSEQDINNAFAAMENPQPVQATIPSHEPASSSGHKGILTIVVIILLFVCAGGAFAAYHFGLLTGTVSSTTAPTSATSTIPVNSEQSPIADQNLITANPDCGGQSNIQYYDAGTVTSGIYGGYHRILADVPSCSPANDYAVIFATKDYQTFIVSSSSPEDNSLASDLTFNATKVTGSADIPTDAPPAMIQLGNFVLVQHEYYLDSTPTSTPLTSLVPGLTFYADPVLGYTSSDTTYLGSYDDVLIKTPSGPLFDYLLLPQEDYSSSTPYFSQTYYTQDQISSSVPLYKTYGVIVPNVCSGGFNTNVLQNISQSDLVQVGTTSRGVALYTLKNTDHPLNHDEYNSKVALGNDYTLPSFSAYVAKDPILTFQDPWGRWIGLGEFDYYNSEGGCGKPVIYLYPPKPTEVTVKFTTPMRLTTDIPTYANGWDVLAHPDGELTDLQPALTNCSSIDSTVSGSEYAQAACKQNDYPYLYWAGQASGQYPTPTGGWIVPQGNISDFLNQKLTQIGLTDKEKSDMMGYWVPELLAKNAPYYRISFFKTAQMNQFIPMQVTPTPNTIIRVFLDWSPLSAVPAVQPQPQVLNHIDRTGFTLVEWGGLR